MNKKWGKYPDDTKMGPDAVNFKIDGPSTITVGTSYGCTFGHAAASMIVEHMICQL